MNTFTRKLALPFALTLTVLSLTACSSSAGNGAVIGALTGAAIGKSTSNHHDSRALWGAVVGGAAGAAMGSQRDIQRPQYYQRPEYRRQGGYTYYR